MRGNSKVLRGHSRTMRAISLLTITFLPFSAVSADFSTQFLGYYSGVAEGEPQRFQVNPSFWIMFLISVPLTVLVVGWWYLWEKGHRCHWWGEKWRRKTDARALEWSGVILHSRLVGRDQDSCSWTPRIQHF